MRNYSITGIIKSGLFILAVISLVSLINFRSADIDKYSSIAKHISNKYLNAQVKGLGGHQENCIKFNLKNITPDTLYILIEPGRRLVSQDTALQDILIVKETKILLSPYEQKEINGYGFCCEASRKSPYKDADFSIGYMSPSDWIKLADVISNNNFPAQAVQNAIWVFSDNHDISSIYSQNAEEIDLLRRTVASIKGIEIPWYYVTYAKDTSMLFSNKPEKVLGNIEYYMNKTAVITINIRNKSGTVVKTLIPEVSQGPGKYNYNVNLNVLNWPKGEYEISIYEDFSTLNIKKKFKI